MSQEGRGLQGGGIGGAVADYRTLKLLRIQTGLQRLSAVERGFIADYLEAHREDVVSYVRGQTEGSDRFTGLQLLVDQVLEEQDANVVAGLEMVAEWVRSGTLPPPENLEELARVGRRVARGTRSVSRVVRANLAWRDALCALIEEAGAMMGIPKEKLEPLAEGVMVSCDASIVRTARHFDEQAREIQQQLRENEAKLEFLAMHDPLTALANRGLMFDRLDKALERMRRHPERGGVAVIFVDLDGFKDLNDRCGHLRGDEVLQVIARRLAACVRDQDTVARFGGDEFIVVAEDIADEGAATSLAERILAGVREPIDLGDVLAILSASIGVRLTYDPDLKPDQLVTEADALMYEAKGAGGNRYSMSVAR
jgi:diguanylate cyclase (GGDEF)-like protein